MRVLLLEDQAKVRELLVSALERSGWTVSQAATLTAACEHLTSEGPHVLVADRHLAGGEDGHAFAAAAYTTNEDIAVIYISSSTAAISGRVLRPRESCLAKPFMPAALIEAVATAIRRMPEQRRA